MLRACILQYVGFVLVFTVFGEGPAFAMAVDKPPTSASEGLGNVSEKQTKIDRKTIENRRKNASKIELRFGHPFRTVFGRFPTPKTDEKRMFWASEGPPKNFAFRVACRRPSEALRKAQERLRPHRTSRKSTGLGGVFLSNGSPM